jgi:hypothetical protein
VVHQEHGRAQPDHHDPAGRAENLDALRRLREPVAGRAGGERPGAVREQRDEREDEPEQKDLQGDAAGGVVHEEGEHRDHEDDRLGVRDADSEPLPDRAPGAAPGQWGRDGIRLLPAMPDGLDAEEDDVGGAEELDDREGHDRLLEQRAEAEGDQHRDHDGAEDVADDAQEPADPAERERAADREEHARPGDDDERDRRQCEGEEVGRGDHREC